MFLNNFIVNKKSKSKIGILYICTGKYHIFWNDFYKRTEKYFCNNSEIYYFVFTDYPIKKYFNTRVNHIYQSKLGWPFDTLKRFHIFLSQRKKIEKMDYLFFFNANTSFVDNIFEQDIFPDHKSNGLVSVLHPAFFDHKLVPPFEKNIKSTAFVDANENLNYFQGCLSGGLTKDYLAMSEEIVKMVDIDLKENIIAEWHDESYMNKYFYSKSPKALFPSYAYPEDWILPFPKKIIMYDKQNFGGHNFLREV